MSSYFTYKHCYKPINYVFNLLEMKCLALENPTAASNSCTEITDSCNKFLNEL